MAVTITYNGYALPQQLGKVSFLRGEQAASFTAEFTLLTGGVEAAITSLRAWDKTFSIVAGSWTATFTLGSNSVRVRTTCEKVGGPMDNGARQRLRFTAIVELTTLETDGFRHYTVTCDTNEQGRKTIIIEGEVTGTGSSATAKTAFDAGIAAIQATWVAIFTGTYESPRTVLRPIDRRGFILNFSRTIVELLDPNNRETSGVESRDTTIIFPVFFVERSFELTRGFQGEPVQRYTINWTAMLSGTRDSSTFISEYDTTIRALVIARLQTMFGNAGNLVLEDDRIRYSTTQQQADGNWIATVASPTVSYVETLELDVKETEEPEKYTDGKALSIDIFSFGPDARITQRVTHTARDARPSTPQPPNVAIGGLPVTLTRLRFTQAYTIMNKGRTGTVGDGSHTNSPATDTTMEWTAVYALSGGQTGRATTGGAHSASSQPLAVSVTGKPDVKVNPFGA